MGQTCPTIDVSPKHLAKMGLVTAGLKQMPCRPLHVTYSYFTNTHSGLQLLGSELQTTQILPVCQKHHHHWRYQTQSSHLHKQQSSPSSIQHILKRRTASHPQVHIKSHHCLCSAYYAVTEHRRGFRQSYQSGPLHKH